MTDPTDHDAEQAAPELDAAEELVLGELLRNAFRPSEIDPQRHERLLSAALVDPFAEPSPEELAESERLRQALDGEGDHEDLHLARALSAAFAPTIQRPLAATLRDTRRGNTVRDTPAPTARASRGQVVFVRFAAVTTALAVAAAVLLQVTSRAPESSAPAPDLTTLALAQSRSTAEFFHPDSAGAPSERIDRIASVRGRELRDNRYALWGVR